MTFSISYSGDNNWGDPNSAGTSPTENSETDSSWIFGSNQAQKEGTYSEGRAQAAILPSSCAWGAPDSWTQTTPAPPSCRSRNTGPQTNAR